MLNGRTLREMRLRAGMTLQDLSAKTGLSKVTIDLAESGKRSALNDKTLIALAKGFDMDVIELEKALNGAEEKGSAESQKAATA